MYKAIYSLGEYRITVYENGSLWWQTHSHFVVQRSGKCFILGDILIIGHWSHEESGYLKLEFFEQLQKLPVWNKTRYYCFAFELLDVSTGQSLTNDLLERFITPNSGTGSQFLMNMSPGTFRHLGDIKLPSPTMLVLHGKRMKDCTELSAGDALSSQTFFLSVYKNMTKGIRVSGNSSTS